MSSFFKRRNQNASLIPPVAPTAGQQAPQPGGFSSTAPPSYRSTTPNAYAGGGDSKDDPYAPSSTPPPDASNPYTRRALATAQLNYKSTQAPNDPYGDAQASDQRSELLSGFLPAQKQATRKYGYEGREQEEDFDEEEEVEGIKQEMRGIKQESLASTRNALRIAREAEDTARGTVGKLADQSERIANTERHLDIAKANNQRAEDKADELKQLNRSIFRPVITWNKDAKRAAAENRIHERHLNERLDREKARQDVIDTRQRLGRAGNAGPGGYSESLPQPGEQAAKKKARERYQFEATASDDELEDELDENLNETLEVTKRLKDLAVAAGEEIDTHNRRLVGVTDKTSDLDYAIMRNTDKLKRAAGMK